MIRLPQGLEFAVLLVGCVVWVLGKGRNRGRGGLARLEKPTLVFGDNFLELVWRRFWSGNRVKRAVLYVS